jgi:hypothetical protein
MRMRFRRERRAGGPAAAHACRYGPQSPPRISPPQRDAIYRLIIEQTKSAGETCPFDARGHLHPDGRLVLEEVTDNLQLILDSLGLGETSSGAHVVLDLPAEQLRRTFSRLRQKAIEQREASPEESAVIQEPYERAVIVIEACDRVLARIDGDTPMRGLDSL